jgi:hypothetical protein
MKQGRYCAPGGRIFSGLAKASAHRPVIESMKAKKAVEVVGESTNHGARK